MNQAIGHEKNIEELLHDVRDDHVSHGYLFVGPKSLGKFHIAKRFTKILQCAAGGCGRCACCKQIEKGYHLDTIELQDDGESIKIEQIRDIIGRLSMTRQSPYKVLLLQNIGRMTDQAANCMLKTLEEPTEKTVFIFTVGSLRYVLPTIVSRMRVLHFRKVSDERLEEEIKKQYPNLEEGLLKYVITLALGRPGRAISLIEDSEMLMEIKQLYSEIETMLHKRSPSLNFMMVDSIVKSPPERLERFIEILLLLARKFMLETKAEKEKKHYADFIKRIITSQDLLKKNINTKLLLENLLLHMV